jgi:hypothetical protein
MRKILLFCAVLFAFQLPVNLMAQEDFTEVIFNAILSETFSINVLPGGETQTATFASAADYNNGVTEAGGIVDGFSTITVEATANWDVQILAPDFTDGGGQVIPINNLGVYCTDGSGTHTIGNEVMCDYTTDLTALGLSTAEQMLLYNGTGNAGTAAENEFILHWEMGTMHGSMNPISMFNQMLAGDFDIGTYQTTVTLNLYQD